MTHHAEQYPPHHPPPAMEAPGASAGMALGIVSIVLAFSCSLAGIIVGIIGLQKSRQAKDLMEQHPGQYVNESSASIGYICSIIGLALSIVFVLLGFLWLIVVLLFTAFAAPS